MISAIIVSLVIVSINKPPFLDFSVADVIIYYVSHVFNTKIKIFCLIKSPSKYKIEQSIIKNIINESEWI